jgi:hypothetical protein
MAAQTVPMFSPDGQLGDIPFEKMNAARDAGFKAAVVMQSPDGKQGYIPADRAADAAKSGLNMLGLQKQEVKDPGFWATAGSQLLSSRGVDVTPEEVVSGSSKLVSDLGAMVKSLPNAALQAVRTATGTNDLNEEASRTMEQVKHFDEQGQGPHPYSLFYRVLSPLAENLGVNVRGMEQSAAEGDRGGVAGHAAAVPTAMAITEGAGKVLPKTVELATDAAPKVAEAVRNVTPKQAAQVTAGAAGAVGGHGPLSVPAATASAHYMGNIVESILGKDRANSPIIPRRVEPVYPGAPLPENPGVFPGANLPATPAPELIQANALFEGGKPAPPAPSAGLGQIPVRVEPKQLPVAFQPRPAPYRAPLGSVDNPLRPATTGEVAAPTPQTPTSAEPITAPSPSTREPLAPSESTLSGESALRKILTGQDNANLMKIAKSRGINVSQEAQLKPGVADGKLINKIIEDMDPDELDNFRSQFIENTRFKHSFGDIGPEAWKALSMQSYFPDVKIPATVLKRMETSIRNSRAMAEPAPEVPTDAAHMQSLAEQSLEMLRKRRAAQKR